MLRIEVPEMELFNDKTNEFFMIGGVSLQMEHSLVSLSSWESKWHIPLLGKEDKTKEQMLDYVRCMTLTEDVDPITYRYLPNDLFSKIVDYIHDPATATTIHSIQKTVGGKKETITAEIIYYWMVTLGVPGEYETWNLNRLFTLLSVISIKNSPQKKIGRREAAEWRAAENARRRAKYHSKG